MPRERSWRKRAHDRHVAEEHRAPRERRDTSGERASREATTNGCITPALDQQGRPPCSHACIAPLPRFSVLQRSFKDSDSRGRSCVPLEVGRRPRRSVRAREIRRRRNEASPPSPSSKVLPRSARSRRRRRDVEFPKRSVGILIGRGTCRRRRVPRGPSRTRRSCTPGANTAAATVSCGERAREGSTSSAACAAVVTRVTRFSNLP